jgi:hypothetical protein
VPFCAIGPTLNRQKARHSAEPGREENGTFTVAYGDRYNERGQKCAFPRPFWGCGPPFAGDTNGLPRGRITSNMSGEWAMPPDDVHVEGLLAMRRHDRWMRRRYTASEVKDLLGVGAGNLGCGQVGSTSRRPERDWASCGQIVGHADMKLSAGAGMERQCFRCALFHLNAPAEASIGLPPRRNPNEMGNFLGAE